MVVDAAIETVDPADETFYDFVLPQDDFEDMMFARRLAPDGSTSPPLLAHQLSKERRSMKRRQSTVDDTDGERYCFELVCLGD